MSRAHRGRPLTAMVAVAGLALVVAACGGSGGGSSSGSTAAPGAGGSSGSNGTSAPPKSFPTSHTLTLSFLQDPGQPPDPDVYYAASGLLLTRNAYEGLVQYQTGTATRTIIPSLATSWTVSPDGLTYTFQLRQGVTFHDGTPFTSAAVAPSFARRAAVNGGPAYMVSDVASVATPTPSTAVIKLKTRNTAFLDYLASPYGPVMESPTAIAAHAGSDHDQTYLQTHDIGTGPYTITQAKVGVSYQLQAYPGYWGAKPYYTTVNMPVIDDVSTQEIQFNSGQIAGILHGLTTTAARQYQGSSSAKLYLLPTLQSEVLYVNANKGFLTSQAARRALLKAINVPAIVAGVFPGGRATVPSQTAPAHLISEPYAQQKLSYDPSALKKIVGGLAGSQRTITIGYDTTAPDDQLISEQIGAQLLGDGITAKVVGYTTSTTFGWVGSISSAQGPSTPNLLVDSFWPDADNPYTWTHISFDPTGGLQYLNCQVPGEADLNNQALATGSLGTYSQASDLALASGCWLNLADKNDTMVFQPWLQGVAAAHVVTAPWALLFAKLYPA